MHSHAARWGARKLHAGGCVVAAARTAADAAPAPPPPACPNPGTPPTPTPPPPHQVCEREVSDKKGGHLARRKADGRLMLRESAMCPDEDKSKFEDITL